ncbi:MAG: hypothetical protein ACYCZF_17800 [Anaerolineae bacterium]
MSRKLEGLLWQQRYNDHMGCIKGCLEYLGIACSYPWLYGGTGHAFVLNMNDTVNVDSALVWNVQPVLELGKNLGFRIESLVVDHTIAREMPAEQFRYKQREAWDFVRSRIDQDLPCYAWEVCPIPMYSVVNGYDDAGYIFSGWNSGGTCPWEKLGTFDVKQIAVYCLHPLEPASDQAVVRDALNMVLSRVERPNGWATQSIYRTGLPAYELWTEALETGRAYRDGAAFINQVWLECRCMAVAFLEQAGDRLPGRCDDALTSAINHYSTVRDALVALAAMHPERPDSDWTSHLTSAEGARLVREAGKAESKGIVDLKRIAAALEG